MKNVTIYSTATCGFCKMIKSYLSDKGVKYEVKMADEDESIAKELYEKSGQLGVPFTVITDEEGKEDLILGFDRPKINAALGL
jgi:glutaredoxin